MKSALRTGVRGFMSKAGPSTDVVEVLKIVVRGGAYLSPNVATQVMDWVKSAKSELNPALESLTAREKQVLRLLAQGKGSKEIASDLNLGVETIRTYRKTLMQKLERSQRDGTDQVCTQCRYHRVSKAEGRRPHLRKRMSPGLWQRPQVPAKTAWPCATVERCDGGSLWGWLRRRRWPRSRAR